jgi:hypothetical protein
MSLSILTNISAMNTQQNLLKSSNAVATSMSRLSSGLRINSAADDAAGYAISQGLTSQVNGLNQASSNTNDAVSMVQTASSSLNDVQNMLQRVYELGVQYNNGSNSSTDKSDIQAEVNQLTQEIDRQQTSSNFNGLNLLNGTAGRRERRRHPDCHVLERRGHQRSGRPGLQLGQRVNRWNGHRPVQRFRSDQPEQRHQQHLQHGGNAGCGAEPSPVHLRLDLFDRAEPVGVQ